MSNPFKKISQNVQETKSDFYNHNNIDEAKSQTNCCKNCGAPRPAKTNLTLCQYCRTQFMNLKTIIKE